MNCLVGDWLVAHEFHQDRCFRWPVSVQRDELKLLYSPEDLKVLAPAGSAPLPVVLLGRDNRSRQGRNASGSLPRGDGVMSGGVHPSGVRLLVLLWPRMKAAISWRYGGWQALELMVCGGYYRQGVRVFLRRLRRYDGGLVCRATL